MMQLNKAHSKPLSKNARIHFVHFGRNIVILSNLNQAVKKCGLGYHTLLKNQQLANVVLIWYNPVFSTYFNSFLSN